MNKIFGGPYTEVSHLNTVKKLSELRPSRWFACVAGDWSMIAGWMYFALHSHSYLLAFMALVIIGNRQHALAVLGHEGAHYSICRLKSLNDLLANLLCLSWLGLTVQGYRSLHLQHHKERGTEADPEVAHKRGRAPQWDLPLKPVKMAGIIFKDFFGGSVQDLWIILTFSAPPRKSSLILPFTIHCSIMTFSWLTHDWRAAGLWYASLATTFMAFFRIRLWLEHQGTNDTHRLNLKLWESALFAPHNIWLHWEHHRFPSVPLYNLHKLRLKLAGVPPISLKDLLRKLIDLPEHASGEMIRE